MRPLEGSHKIERQTEDDCFKGHAPRLQGIGARELKTLFPHPKPSTPNPTPCKVSATASLPAMTDPWT